MEQIAMDDDDYDLLIDIHRQTMIEIEATLSGMENIVSTLPLLTIEDLEPHRGLIIQHLEEMLSRMKNLRDDDDGASADSSHSGENNDENVGGVEENEVCGHLSYFVYCNL